MCGNVGPVEIVFSFVVIVGDKGYYALHFIFVCNIMEMGAQCPPLWILFRSQQEGGKLPSSFSLIFFHDLKKFSHFVYKVEDNFFSFLLGFLFLQFQV
jgi:hypothetical protein